MDVIPLPNGKSWSVRDQGREIGLIIARRIGRAAASMYCSYSGKVGIDRYDLGVQRDLEAALERIRAFHDDPQALRSRVHLVLAEAVERRRP